MTIFERMAQIRATIRDRVNAAREADRDFTEAENTELNNIRRELRFLELEAMSAEMQRDRNATPAVSGLVSFVRDVTDSNAARTVYLRAEGETPADPTIMTGDVTNVTPLTVGELIHDVEERLIWDRIGIRMPTGLAGSYEWPVVGDMTATFAGEGVDVAAQKVDISKVPAVQQRVAIVADLTRESVINSAGQIESIVREAMPKAIARAINNVVLSPTKVDGQTLEGPFVNATKETVPFTFAGLNGAKAKLLGKGFEEEGLVFVMDAATKATLEATPKDSGSGIMTIEDGKLCGLPVFVSSKMGGKIGLGDFRYQVVGQFGTPSFIVDPYSQASKGKVRFTINANFGTATLLKNAFMILTAKA